MIFPVIIKTKHKTNITKIEINDLVAYFLL